MPYRSGGFGPVPGKRTLPDPAICVPARDEETELPRLFDALERLDIPSGGNVTVCLLLDGCTDDSPALASAYRARSRHNVHLGQRDHGAANAGEARRGAMAMGLRVLDGDDGLLLTTDADSAPATDWLTTVSAGLRVADVVAGRIVRHGNRPNRLQDRLDSYYDALFALRRRLDPVSWEAAVTHHSSSGANLGIRAGAYRMVGGFAPVPNGEDARLVDDAARAGLRVRRDARCVVHSSDRREGRATSGYALGLRFLDRSEPADVSVAHPADAAWQYRMQAIARGAYADDRLDIAATALGLTPDHLRGVARDCPNAEAFAMRVVPVPPGGMRGLSLPAAEVELALLADERCVA